MSIEAIVRIAAAGLVVAVAGVASARAQSLLDAEIRWTSHGVPHIKAADYAGLGYGYGYAIATDELCVLAEHVVTLRGERSQWLAPTAPAPLGVANLDSDLFYRVQLSQADVTVAGRSLSNQARELARGYAAGFNRYVRDMPAKVRAAGCGGMPLPTMTSTDVVRFMIHIGALWRAQDLAGAASDSTWEALVAAEPAKTQTALLSGGPADEPEDPIGSNAWAYGSDVTGTGAAIVVANPHTSWTPSWQRMHQLHLSIPGEIDVAGADFAGVPLPVTGFTRDVAWAIKSPIGVRYHLLLALDVRGGQRPVHRVDGKPRPITPRTVSVPVRETNGVVRSKTFRIPYSDGGPLYKLPPTQRRAGGWYAITDPNSGNALGIDQLLAVAKARNIEEFERAVVGKRGITARLIAGDRHGAALYVEAGPLLDAKDATLGTCAVGDTIGVVDGARSECMFRDPSGKPKLAASKAIPSVMTRGAVQFASTSYRYAVFDRLLGGYSILFGDDREPPGARALMSHRQLGEVLSDGRITLDEATDVMFGNRNYAAETTLDAILQACDRVEENSGAARACTILRAWDRHNNGDSRGALLFAQAWPRLQAIPNFYGNRFDPTRPYAVLSVSTTAADAIISALSDTVESLQRLGLRGDEPWGQVLARVTDAGRVPLHGGSAEQGVLNVITAGPLSAQGYADIRYGSSYAHVVTWQAGELVANVMLAHGQSTQPDSSHYADQLPLFAQKRLVKMPFTDAQIEADPEYRAIRLQEHARRAP